MIAERVDILDLSYDQLKAWLRAEGEPTDNADRLWKGIFREGAASFEAIAGLGDSLKAKLAEKAPWLSLKPLVERVSLDGQTVKVLFELDDGKTIEATMMFYRKAGLDWERRTVCVSSQVGCAVGCSFCATGQQGFERNLRTGEILEQVLYFMRYIREKRPERKSEAFLRAITNVVFMGMGEPLANYENVRQTISILNSQKGLGLGNRQVTLSTAGLAPQIQKLSREKLQLNLAVSLHAASDEVRDRLVPVNKKYPLNQLLAACREYQEKTGRSPFFEYALFEGVNDSEKDAEDLIRLLSGWKSSINLIAGNVTGEGKFQPSSPEVALAFQKKLLEAGFRTMIRSPKGADIEAGCGQLKSRWLKSDQH